jgi:acetyltransferase-like isoleucine patch superfamily enzyme
VLALVKAFLVLLPWSIRRRLLEFAFGYDIHPTSRIAWAWVYPRSLTMDAGSRIGSLTVVKGLDKLSLGRGARIGRLNWISAYPSGAGPHFAHLERRRAHLLLAEHAAITNRHIIDCTEIVVVGRFSTIGGFRCQVLTHSIDLRVGRQDARCIEIGEYCFIGTACTLLGGCTLPDFSVLGANSLLNQAYSESWRIYAGVPARPVGVVDASWKYFSRSQGFVV